MAYDSQVIRHTEHSKELYSSNEFPPLKMDITPEEEIALILRYNREGYSPDLTLDEEVVIDWHEQLNNVQEPISKAPRGDKMLLYRIAAALFNNQLAIDQKGNDFLGIKPSRLDEKPITASAIERAINRYEKAHKTSVE